MALVSLRQLLDYAAELDARKTYKIARDAIQALCQTRYEAFGSAGHASKIKSIPLAEMVKRYS